MFQRILVPLDGSKRAAQVLPLAARLARTAGGMLFLVWVIDLFNEVRIYSPVVSTYLPEIEEKERASAMGYLAGIAARSELTGLRLHRVVMSGSVIPSLLQVIQQEQIDLVVLCSHGYTGFKRWALGSVAQKVVRQSPVPVCLVREPHLALLNKIAQSQPIRASVALDGSPFAEAALLPTAYLVAACNNPARGELVLLRVVSMQTGQEQQECQQQQRDAALRQAILRAEQAYLQEARANLLWKLPELQGIQITCAAVEGGDTAEALLQTVERSQGAHSQHASDLLALTTHGRSGIRRWVLGSVTERVLQGGTLPLLVVHAPESTEWPEKK